MKVEESGFNGLMLIYSRLFRDERGFFRESYSSRRFMEAGIDFTAVQDNESKSVRGVVRGLHFQLAPYAQAKLVRVVSGSIFDVALDLRKGSPTYGQWFGMELSDDNSVQVLIPKGFAHGFSVLSHEAIVQYKCDNYYRQEAERSIHPFDEALAIDWRIDAGHTILSMKDMKAPPFAAAEMNF